MVTQDSEIIKPEVFQIVTVQGFDDVGPGATAIASDKARKIPNVRGPART